MGVLQHRLSKSEPEMGLLIEGGFKLVLGEQGFQSPPSLPQAHLAISTPTIYRKLTLVKAVAW